MSYYHNTCPQADEWPSYDGQLTEWMDLLDANAEACQGYIVPTDNAMRTSW